MTPGLAALLREHGVDRVSLGAQSFQPHLLDDARAARRARTTSRRAVHTLRDAGFDNISLDLIYGIPGQSAADLERDLAEALALEPEHLSCYELEAKPGTRFTHAHGDELERQADAMEDYFERVVETLTGAGYRWYETANFCRARRRARPARAAQPRLLARARLPRDRRRRGLDGRRDALAERAEPRRATCRAAAGRAAAARARASSHAERAGARARDARAPARRAAADWRASTARSTPTRSTTPRAAGPRSSAATGDARRLTPRGRFLGGGVTAELLA